MSGRAEGGAHSWGTVERTRFGLGVYLLVLGLLAPIAVVWAWPAVASVPGEAPAVIDGNVSANATYHLQAWPTTSVAQLPAPTVTLLLVLLGGFIGAWLHATLKFVYKVGNEGFRATWAWWCVLLPWMGALLAAGTFAVFRGVATLLEPAITVNVPIPPAAPFGFAFMAGLFSRRATMWLDRQASRVFGSSREGEANEGEEGKPEPTDAGGDGGGGNAGGPTSVPVVGPGHGKPESNGGPPAPRKENQT